MISRRRKSKASLSASLPTGLPERAISFCEADPVFDLAYYQNANGLEFKSKREAVEHYFTQGWKDGLSPNKQFDPQLYLSMHANDLIEKGVEPFWHFVAHGHAERYRIPNETLGSFVNYYSKNHDGEVGKGQFSRIGCFRYLSGNRRRWVGICIGKPFVFEKLTALIKRIKRKFDVDVIVFNLTPDSLIFETLKQSSVIDLCADLDRDYIEDDSVANYLAGWMRDPLCVTNLIISDENFGVSGLHLHFAPGASQEYVLEHVADRLIPDLRVPIYFLQTDWTISGVNTFTRTLTTELKESSRFRPVILLTNNISNEEFLSLPDVEVQRIPFFDDRPTHLKTMKHFLERQKCLMIPNYDKWGESVIPGLSQNVKAVGIVHSDDDAYYERVARIGRYFDYCVSVSSAIEAEVVSIVPELEGRSEVIRYGIEPACAATRRTALIDEKAAALKKEKIVRFCYVGRLVDYQKRAMDLAGVVQCLDERGIKYHFDIAGDGGLRDELGEKLADQVEAGSVTFHGRLEADSLKEIYARCHALVLVSEFEGLPLSVLEAISSGCVPVMYEIRSGIEEILADGQSCLLAPQGDKKELARLIGTLKSPRNYKKLANGSAAAFEALGLNEIEMTRKYLRIFNHLMREDLPFKRPKVYAAPEYKESGALPPPV